MYVIVYNWRAVPLVLGAIALGVVLGVGTGLLLSTVGLDWGWGVCVGLFAAGLTLLVVDYFRWRRRDPGGPPFVRLIAPRAGGHVFFIPCWVWGGAAIFIAVVGSDSIDERVAQAFGPSLLMSIGLLGLLLPPIYDIVRPYDRFRWAAPGPEKNESITPR